MMIDLDYGIGNVVYYVDIKRSESKAYLVEDVIEGFHLRRIKGSENISIGVDFQGKNNVPIRFVSRNKEAIQKIVDEYNKYKLI